VRSGQTWTRISEATGGVELLAGLVITQKMIGESRAFGVGRVVARGVRCAVTEEEHAAGLQFDVDGLGFVREAANVVVAVSVALVRQKRFPRIGNDAHGAVCDRGIVDRDPHGGAAHGLWDLEIGVILMPRCSHAGLAGFEENLIEVQRDRWTDQAGDGIHNLRGKGQGADERAVKVGGAELKVLFGLRGGLAVAVGGHVA